MVDQPHFNAFDNLIDFHFGAYYLYVNASAGGFTANITAAPLFGKVIQVFSKNTPLAPYGPDAFGTQQTGGNSWKGAALLKVKTIGTVKKPRQIALIGFSSSPSDTKFKVNVVGVTAPAVDFSNSAPGQDWVWTLDTETFGPFYEQYHATNLPFSLQYKIPARGGGFTIGIVDTVRGNFQQTQDGDFFIGLNHDQVAVLTTVYSRTATPLDCTITQTTTIAGSSFSTVESGSPFPFSYSKTFNNRAFGWSAQLFKVSDVRKELKLKNPKDEIKLDDNGNMVGPHGEPIATLPKFFFGAKPYSGDGIGSFGGAVPIFAANRGVPEIWPGAAVGSHTYFPHYVFDNGLNQDFGEISDGTPPPEFKP